MSEITFKGICRDCKWWECALPCIIGSPHKGAWCGMLVAEGSGYCNHPEGWGFDYVAQHERMRSANHPCNFWEGPIVRVIPEETIYNFGDDFGPEVVMPWNPKFEEWRRTWRSRRISLGDK
jgi:hypothetical protein